MKDTAPGTGSEASLSFNACNIHLSFDIVNSFLYPQLTRTHTVLTGRKTPMLLQSPCQYKKYCPRTSHCLNAFLLRQNCYAPDSNEFSSDFCFLRRRCVVTHQGENGKKRRKGILSGVCALVNRGYKFLCNFPVGFIVPASSEPEPVQRSAAERRLRQGISPGSGRSLPAPAPHRCSRRFL